ncbi:MAG TPA: rod shape-determining protein MreC [Gammaproteobacteria bacterium]|nr:rod shape-determining protein MreC [Gammaproteobacteria bacterium]
MAVFRRQRSPQLFSSRPAGALRTLFMIATSIMLMVYDHQTGSLKQIHAALATVVWPVQVIVDAPHSLLTWAGEKLATHRALLTENEQLKSQLLQEQATLQQFAALQQENQRLRDLMQAAAQVTGRVSAATILSAALDPFRHLVVIDKGTHDGVYQGQTVLDAYGIVGQVTRADPLASEVTLISDPGQAIQVEVNRTGLRTLAVGNAELSQLTLPYVTNSADIKEGDLVVTSGLGGHYPAGYPVGIITRFDRDPAEPFAHVSARTAADLSSGREVLLFWPSQPPPQTELAPKPAPVIKVVPKSGKKRP